MLQSTPQLLTLTDLKPGELFGNGPDSDEFNTPHLLLSSAYATPFETELNVQYSNQYYFPEDERDFQTMIFVIDEATNSSVPIINFSLDSSGPGDFSTESNIEGVNLKFVYDAGGGSNAEWVQAYVIHKRLNQAFSACTSDHLFHVRDQLDIDFVLDYHDVGHV
jgi:hypothetical protein